MPDTNPGPSDGKQSFVALVTANELATIHSSKLGTVVISEEALDIVVKAKVNNNSAVSDRFVKQLEKSNLSTADANRLWSELYTASDEEFGNLTGEIPEQRRRRSPVMYL